MVKVKLSPYFLLTEHHAMEAYWGSGGVAPRILETSALYGNCRFVNSFFKTALVGTLRSVTIP
jgi:hypothetical protein